MRPGSPRLRATPRSRVVAGVRERVDPPPHDLLESGRVESRGAAGPSSAGASPEARGRRQPEPPDALRAQGMVLDLGGQPDRHRVDDRAVRAGADTAVPEGEAGTMSVRTEPKNWTGELGRRFSEKLPPEKLFPDKQPV